MSKAKLNKRAIDNIIASLCKLAARFYPYSLHQKLKHLKIKVYTYWLLSEIKTIGENSYLYYPINLRGGKYCSIGDNTAIGPGGYILAWDKYMDCMFTPEIIIGDNTWIGDDCHISATNKIEIGNNVLIGKKVTISDNSHGKTDIELLSTAPKERQLFSKGPVIIEDNVWLGDKVTILSGVRIGKNAIVGANSVVTKDVGENCVVGGIPAKNIKSDHE